ncbi:GMC oxidoreductase [Bradyrhizobium sp. 1.29L]
MSESDLEGDHFDVIIVGSGAAGGMAAFELSMSGLRVLMLEAGRDYDPVTETPMFQTPELAPLHGASSPDKTWGFYDASVGAGWTIDGEPYEPNPDEIGDAAPFKWWRPRMLGGRTNHWDRVSLRYGPYDFKPYSRDGLGFDWPITYQELAPWYDKVEELIGVTGRVEELENTPDSPAGISLPPPPPRVYELFVTRALASMGIPVAAIRAAILTRPHRDRAACFYATACMRGCSIRANFQSTTVLIPPALGTGRLTIRCNAGVYRVNVDEASRATGVDYFDRKTGKATSVCADAVILAAGTCESIRILFNSATKKYPKGLANSSGLLGRYLMDSTGTAILAHVPALERFPPQNEDGISIGHIYVPWWGYEQQKRGELNFPRGYQIEFSGGWKMPTMGLGDLLNYNPSSGAMFGPRLRREICRKYGSVVVFGGEGEMIPNEASFCEINPDRKDKWGVPTLKFSWKWGEYEKRQVEHMFVTFREVVRRLGGKILKEGTMLAGGEMIHEVGGARMGTKRSNSCVNHFGQAWDVENLFVVDGASFASKPHKNPTLTIMALAARASAHIAERARRGEL